VGGESSDKERESRRSLMAKKKKKKLSRFLQSGIGGRKKVGAFFYGIALCAELKEETTTLSREKHGFSRTSYSRTRSRSITRRGGKGGIDYRVKKPRRGRSTRKGKERVMASKKVALLDLESLAEKKGVEERTFREKTSK